MAGNKRGWRKGRLAAARRLVSAGEEKCCPTKRKAAGSVSVSVSGDVPNAGAGEAFPSPAVRERLKSDLLTFPEVAVLDERQLYDAVDRIIKESTPSTATPTTQGMFRFDDESISDTFKHARWLGTSTIEDHPPSGVVAPGWLEERRKMLDEQMKPEKWDDAGNSRFMVAKMRVDLLTKGYVEFPMPYLEYTPPLPARPARSPPKNMTSVVAG